MEEYVNTIHYTLLDDGFYLIYFEEYLQEKTCDYIRAEK